ncbi:PepSY-like domain-containing protein [Spirosoma sp. SC4-14]|uniref:PepSY-like domain-containing protein n=1 Tax=Spirosoma sp. SC4-14 TaxID=3128900 RepID=UPI0030CE430B
MKRFWAIGLTTLTLSLAACQKDNNSPAPDDATARIATTTGGKLMVVSPDKLPDAIKTYIQNQYASATIRQAGKGPRGNYAVLVDQNGTETVLFFKADGSFKTEHTLKVKSLGASALPTLANTYIQKHYPNAAIRRVAQGPRGNYGVLLQSGNTYELLVFTKNGVFLKQIDRASGGKLIETSELPSAITTYITSNYAGATIKQAGQGPKGNYGIVIEIGGKRKALIFDQTGTFLKEVSR